MKSAKQPAGGQDPLLTLLKTKIRYTLYLVGLNLHSVYLSSFIILSSFITFQGCLK